MKARVSQLHKTETDWQILIQNYQDQNKEFVPQPGEIIVYDPDENYNYARIKIGDGQTPLQDLAFVIDSVLVALLQDTVSKNIDAGRITSNT